jgi:hypothetical protein
MEYNTKAVNNTGIQEEADISTLQGKWHIPQSRKISKGKVRHSDNDKDIQSSVVDPDR